MPRRFVTDEALEAEMVPRLIEALYPVLIPMEQQDTRIQARNHAKITEVARKAWREFVNT